MNPKLIVIDALDGVGKTTVGHLLAQELNCVFWNTPGPMLRTLSPQILSCLKDSQLAKCLFYAASVLSVGQQAKELLDSGTSVIIDRYWLSTISYARARGVYTDLCSVEESIIKPDISIILELSEKDRQARLYSRGMTSCDFETLDPRFRNTVWNEMRKYRSNGLGPTHIINTDGMTSSETCAKIKSILQTSI
jgi:dTMP kinase